MLMFSGVLLLLGFVMLMSVLVMVNNLEDGTLRARQGEIIRDADNLLLDMNETLQEFVAHEGNPDNEAFKNLSHALERSVQEKAAISGIYASVRLDDDPDSTIYQRPHRCMGYDPDTTQEGIIRGWEEETRRHGVAGAVYTVAMTDGERSFHTPYYVKFFECVKDTLPTHAYDGWAGPGTLTNLSASKVINSDPMNLTETNLDPSTEPASPMIDTDSFETRHWIQPGNLLEADTQVAKYTSGESHTNYIRFKLLAPDAMRPGDHLESPEFQVIASHNLPAADGRDQNLMLRVHPPGHIIAPPLEKTIGPLEVGLQVFNVSFPNSPAGGPNWTHTEIIDSRWELTVEGAHNPSREIYVDHFNMTGGLLTMSPYRLNATLEWEEIPRIYTDHELYLRYKIEPGTVGETFELRTRDVGPGGNGTWWTITELQDTQGSWEVFQTGLELLEGHDKRLEFRIVDTDHTDTDEPEDEDTIQIDTLRVWSHLQVS